MPHSLDQVDLPIRQWFKSKSDGTGITWDDLRKYSRRLARKRMIDAATQAATEKAPSDAQDKR
jgi:hypothetical protein